MKVADLTDEHVGWLIRVTEPDPHPLGPPHRQFVLLKIRRAEGWDKVGLLAPADPPWAGREHIYPAETPCELVREVRKPRRKRARPA